MTPIEKLQAADQLLAEWLTDNTIDDFDEVPEVDEARGLVQDAIELLKPDTKVDQDLANYIDEYLREEIDRGARLEDITRFMIYNAIEAFRGGAGDIKTCKYGNEPASCTSSPMDCQCAIDAAHEE